MKPIWCNNIPESMLNWGVSICHGYMCMLLYMKPIWCNSIPEIYAKLGAVNLPWVYVHAALCETYVE